MESDNEDEDWNKPVDESVHLYNTPYDDHKIIKPETTHPRVILHIDIDCFYAQVEMLRNPDLKNKPLGIQQKYIIVTCNYVAREQGLTKLMTIKDALEKCPDIVLVCGEDLTNYRHMSYKISNYLQKYCPLVERLGFDENFLDITELVNDRIHNHDVPLTTEVKGHVYMSGSEVNTQGSCDCGCQERLTVGSHIGAEIRHGLYKELGITCCGGVAYNKLLSKLVAGTHKPNQQTTLFPQSVNLLMSSLKSVRSIQGIGHTTARRLKELGVVTVTDLQNTDRSVLEDEFGQASVVTMKKLCVGIDDSPVIAFGLPQTLSDEDSFKKCSNIEDAKSRIRQLVNSLLQRLLEDGRRPQTLRLSIRRMLETNRYNNRESRQCNIPSSVFSKFAPDNLAQAGSQLETLAYSLLIKMVDVKSPFHLTLINVAFAKLEQKSSSDISNFFSPKKGACQSVISNADCSQNVTTGSNINAVPIENNAGSKEVVSDLENRKSSPGISPKKKVSGIAKWLVKQPSDSVKRSLGSEPSSVIVKQPSDSMRQSFGSELSSVNVKQTSDCMKQSSGIEQSCSNPAIRASCSTDISNESSGTKGSLKRLSRDSRYGENEGNVAKRKCDKYFNKVGSFKLQPNISELLPPDLDLNVFLELPPDIQKDILNNTAAYGRTEKEKQNIPNLSTCISEDSFKSQFNMLCTSSSTNDSDSKTKENVKAYNRTISTDNEAVDDRETIDQFENVPDEPSLGTVLTVKRDEKGISGTSAQGFERLSKPDFNLKKDWKPSANKNVDIFNLRAENPETIMVPDNVDPAVFKSLPPEIKDELIKQWRKDKPVKTTKTVAPKQQEKLYFKSPKPSSSNNITDYFSKK